MAHTRLACMNIEMDTMAKKEIQKDYQGPKQYQIPGIGGDAMSRRSASPNN